jgi:hypothetical protein
MSSDGDTTDSDCSPGRAALAQLLLLRACIAAVILSLYKILLV